MRPGAWDAHFVVADVCTVMLRLPDSRHALTLENVLCAPDFGCNLLSVGKLTASAYKMTFGGGVCQITNKAGTAMASCKKVGGMYKLHCSIIDNSAFALAAASTSTLPLPLHVWHHRLGHLNERSICLLASGLASDIAISQNHPGSEPAASKSACPPCLAGKQKEVVNRTPQDRATALL